MKHRKDKGLRIAREANARNDGFLNFTAGMRMVLRDRQGRESIRQMRFKVLEVTGDGDKSLFVFDQPRDVQGTALLTHAHINTQGRPVAVSAGPEKGEAHQRFEALGVVHGKRVFLRRHEYSGSGGIHL